MIIIHVLENKCALHEKPNSVKLKRIHHSRRNYNWRKRIAGIRLWAGLGNNFPSRNILVHFTAGKPTLETHHLTLRIGFIVCPAQTILVRRIARKGIASKNQRQRRDNAALYPIGAIMTLFVTDLK
jgi:hypothetical protein